MIYCLSNFVVTAYCACKVCCGNQASGLDASGRRPVEGVTVALPRRFPLGSIVIIEGREYRGTDRLAKKYDERIDIYFRKHSDAIAWGIKNKRVTIITNNK